VPPARGMLLPPATGNTPACVNSTLGCRMEGNQDVLGNSRRMKMHLDNTAGAYRITGYGAGYVAVNGESLTRSFIVTPETLITDWSPQHVDELNEAAFEAVARLSPGVVLLGTGVEQRFPPSSLLAPLLGQGIGIEVMTTAAACRTYNILVAEGRSVVAGLFVH